MRDSRPRNISATPGGIVYRERLSVWMRLFAAFIGTVCGTMIPYVFIVNADWTRISLSAVLVTILSVVVIAISLIFVAIAFVSTMELRFVPARRVIMRARRGPIDRRTDEIAFSRVTHLAIEMREIEDEGPYAVLLMHVSGEKNPIVMGELGDRAEAEAWREEIEKMVRA